MISALITWALFATAVAIWAIFQLTVEKSLSRMEGEWRESDRKFYRGWENIWFAQLNKMARESPQAKPRKASGKAKRVSK